MIRPQKILLNMRKIKQEKMIDNCIYIKLLLEMELQHQSKMRTISFGILAGTVIFMCMGNIHIIQGHNIIWKSHNDQSEKKYETFNFRLSQNLNKNNLEAVKEAKLLESYYINKEKK